MGTGTKRFRILVDILILLLVAVVFNLSGFLFMAYLSAYPLIGSIIGMISYPLCIALVIYIATLLSNNNNTK
ncbi:MAG: hypothetical protein ABGF52_08220 [Candidatus Asgardarchaeum sp.]